MAKQSFHQQVAEKIIEQLKAGTAPWQKRWEVGTCHVPQNAINGRRYRGINNIWLQSQGHSDPRWMTYKQAASVGAQVRKGERGTVVEYWKFTEEVNKTDDKGKEILGDDGKPIKKIVRLERPRVFHAVVFNAAQIDGLPPLEAKALEWDPNEKAEQILKNSGANIQNRAGDRAFYSLSKDSITLPLKEQFLDDGGYYATALHELGHWTGHESRLARDLQHPFGSAGYAREELRAEIASMMLSQELGVAFDPGQHVSYVESWVAVLESEPMEIFRAAADAEKIQGYVMTLSQQQEQQEEQTMQQTMPKAQQNIDEATIAEERRIIEEITNDTLLPRLNALAASNDEAGLKNIEAVIDEMWSLNEDSAFWQRHTQPEGDVGVVFDTHMEKYRYLVDEKLTELLDARYEQEMAQGLLVPDADSHMPETDEDQVKVISDSLTYIYVPFADKDQVKSLGAKWDGQEKSWFIPPGVNQEPFHQWLNSPIQAAQAVAEVVLAQANTPIDVPYKEKEAARALGAKWDKAEKTWYVPEGLNLQLFTQWQKTEAVAQLDAVEQLATTDVPAAVTEAAAELALERQATVAVESPAEKRLYLAVAYEDRFEAKSLGAKWDKDAKSWFISADSPNVPHVQKWLPENQPTNMPAMSPQEEFADKLRELGCVVDGGHPFMNGQKYRIEVVGDKKGERSGFYVAHMDGRPAGYIKNNRTGEETRWKAKGYSLSAEDKAKLSAEAAQKLAEREEKQKLAQDGAVARIKHYMQDYQPVPATGTPYLNAKGIAPADGIFTDRSGEKTFIPVYNTEGELRSMQYIQADGTKRFAKDSEQEGGMHVIGHKDLANAEVIILSEGYATAATINEATDDSVASVATFNSGNLPAVAKTLAQKYPQAKFVVAGDDDLAVAAKQGINPGREKANDAGMLLNCPVVFPIFAPGEQSSDNKIFTDFNDLAQKSKFGKEGVRKQINEAIQSRADLSVLHVNPAKLQQSDKQAQAVEQPAAANTQSTVKQKKAGISR